MIQTFKMVSPALLFLVLISCVSAPEPIREQLSDGRSVDDRPLTELREIIDGHPLSW